MNAQLILTAIRFNLLQRARTTTPVLCLCFITVNAAHFLLDLIAIRDTFRHSLSLLFFDKVCEIIVHLATQQLVTF